MAGGDPYQYDDPEGVVNKENEAEDNQAESNHLVCCCGLQRERESEPDPHALAAAWEALTGPCCLFSPRAGEGRCCGAETGAEGGGERRRAEEQREPLQQKQPTARAAGRAAETCWRCSHPAVHALAAPAQPSQAPTPAGTGAAPERGGRGPASLRPRAARRPLAGSRPPFSLTPHVTGLPERGEAAGRRLRRSPRAGGAGAAPDPTHHGETRPPRPPAPPFRERPPISAPHVRLALQSL